MSDENKNSKPGTSRTPPSASENVQAAGTGNARISTALQLQLKVLRKCIERLEAERSEINTVVKELLAKAITDMEDEIAQVSRMKLLATKADLFQHRRNSDCDDDFMDLD